MDRYATLGVGAASLALENAPAEPDDAGDPDWGVVLGSSLGCWASNAEYLSDLEQHDVVDLSPALFARTVSNTVNGEISIAQRIGGVDHTLVSGWAAGAEALAEAAALLAEGRVRWALAGAVESPAEVLQCLYAARRRERDLAWLPANLEEVAAVCLLTLADRCPARTGPRIRAYSRGHDPRACWSLAAVLRDIRPLSVGTVVLTNTVPPQVRERWERESVGIRLIHLPTEFGELGAAGAPVGVALAATWMREGVLLVARGIEGGSAALVVTG